MTQAKPRFTTIDEYLNYDDGTDQRYELVDGELIAMPPESRLNRKIASFLFEAFIKLGVPSALLAIGTQIVVPSRKVTARQPDLVVLSEECEIALEGASSDIITAELPPPTIVIEIVSPGTTNYDRDYVDKRKEYAARGIPEYWLIEHPERKITTVLYLEGKHYREVEKFQNLDSIKSQSFPNLQLTAEQILRAGQ